jgi:hypothetical protein
VALAQYGDRLQRAGKERITQTGTAFRPGADPTAFTIIRQLPNSVRYQERGDGGVATITFDGSALSRSTGNLTKKDTDLIETLAYDTPDRFFYFPANAIPYRSLGSGFQIIGADGRLSVRSAYEVYLVIDSVQQPEKLKQQPKYYYVNVDTRMVERIQYDDADSPGSKVAVVLSGWSAVSGNRLPSTLERFENGASVLKLVFDAASVSASAADGAFTNAGN